MKTARRAKRPTLKQLAETAGVSIGTASNILSNKVELHSAETVARVLTAARQLGYRPNRVARSLAARRTHTIGVVIERQHAVFTRNPYATAVMDGLVDALLPREYQLKIITPHRLEPHAVWTELDDGTVDGLVLIAPLRESPILALPPTSALPCVVVGSMLPDEYGYYCIDIDNENTMRALVRYLIGCGHRRIGLIKGPDNHWSAIQRVRGYLDEMTAHGICPPAEWIADSNYEHSGGLLATERLLQITPPLTAIIGSNDLLAMGALDACAQQGVPVPDAVSIVGIDDTPMAALVKPPLTTMRSPIHEIGVHAAEALLQQIETGELLRGARLFETTLIVRESVRPR